MRIAFLILIFFWGIAIPCQAQVGDDTPRPQARLQNTIGKSYDKAIWRILDYLIDELQTDPSADGRIISYGTASQILFFQRIVRKRLKIVKFEATRIPLINGGWKPKTEHQFWIVPAGSMPPI